ncbi:MAG: hypothetical protein ACYC7L_15215 [Nitrospirota bacterium]
MRRTVAFIVITFFFAATAYAGESIKEFSVTTADGKSVEFKAGSGSLMVVNVGAHW